MNVYKHELRQNRTATVIWAISILAIAVLYISIYPSIAANPDFSKIIKEFPEAFKKSFGMTNNSLSTFPALYAVILNLVILVGAVQAMNLGAGIISKEVRYKTADFLLSKPVNRYNILTQKLLSVTTLLMLTNIVYLTTTWGLIRSIIEPPFQFEVFLRSSLPLLLVQIFFFSLGFLLGVALPKIRSVIAVSLPTVFGFYVFGLLDTVIGKEKIKYLTPFKFFDLNKLTSGGTYQTGVLIYLGVLVALSIIGSYLIYQKKDIHIT